ncbi:MAG TPA: oxygenase MpaB family protein [Solirubrobacteraceae bacterium]|nr:oxygenase MpaB family protein [Solirubrobacteraceae bacterium]
MSASAAGGLAGPARRSVAQQLWGRWAFLVPFAGRVLSLQAMHPTVAAGLQQHSTVFDQPWQRAAETVGWGLRMLFGDAASVGRQVRERHRSIRGVDRDGRRYHAWNPEAWTWVHLSTFEATRHAGRTLGRLTPAAERRLYGEWRAAGRLFSVRERDMPPTLAEFDEYLADMIARRLVATDAADRLLALLRTRLPPPPWVPAPAPLWAACRRPAGEVAWTLLVGSFPAVLRDRLGIRWGARERARHRAAMVMLRTLDASLPDRLGRIPGA